ncbi:hypothetical protein Psuf_079890 [Phytohabitans suffuscus]|uniref:Uncharacterized protein n=1 Tax=Phytohabitans suffuscus TaxID=624315 RepID=A0A6F8YX88_9ACTN|nr:hypothetical protein Psuf_079890 [Phytohabitans suffuscus]
MGVPAGVKSLINGSRTAWRAGVGSCDARREVARAVVRTADPAAVRNLSRPAQTPWTPGAPPAPACPLRSWARWCSHDHFVAQPAETFWDRGPSTVARTYGRYLPIRPLPVGAGGSVSADRGTDPPLWGPFHTTIYNREPRVRWQG